MEIIVNEMPGIARVTHRRAPKLPGKPSKVRKLRNQRRVDGYHPGNLAELLGTSISK